MTRRSWKSKRDPDVDALRIAGLISDKEFGEMSVAELVNVKRLLERRQIEATLTSALGDIGVPAEKAVRKVYEVKDLAIFGNTSKHFEKSVQSPGIRLGKFGKSITHRERVPLSVEEVGAVPDHGGDTRDDDVRVPRVLSIVQRELDDRLARNREARAKARERVVSASAALHDMADQAARKR